MKINNYKAYKVILLATLSKFHGIAHIEKIVRRNI